MKSLTRVLMFPCLALVSAASGAATVAAADAGVVQTATFASDLAAIDKAVFQAAQMIDLGGSNVLWVLGGGLVALSLVARRLSG